MDRFRMVAKTTVQHDWSDSLLILKLLLLGIPLAENWQNDCKQAIKKILYLQYTNPGGYPPLEHSSRILAEAGWNVVFLGTGAKGAGKLDFQEHPHIKTIRWPFVGGGFLQKVHFLVFGISSILFVLIWRPDWIYASDPLICPIALAIKKITGVKMVYHEHDSPGGEDED